MAWVNNNKKNARFDPNRRDDRLLGSEVVARSQRRVMTRGVEENEEEQGEMVSTDLKDIVALKQDARLEWLQEALLQAAQGKIKVDALYAIVADGGFLASFGTSAASRMKASLHGNSHIFSAKQQKFFQSDAFGAKALAREGKEDSKKEDNRKSKDSARKSGSERCRGERSSSSSGTRSRSRRKRSRSRKKRSRSGEAKRSRSRRRSRSGEERKPGKAKKERDKDREKDRGRRSKSNDESKEKSRKQKRED